MRDRLPALRPPGRWLRFSLRTLFLLTLVFAVVLGVQMKRLRDRKAAVVAIQAAGGTMGVRYTGPKWLRGLINDEQCFWDPVRVSLGPIAQQRGKDEPRLDDASLARLGGVLKSFGRLEILDIRKSAITDHSAELLGALTGIRHLRLSDTQITNRTMRHVGRLGQLESLELYGTAITDECVDDLCQLEHLTNLDIRRTGITSGGLSRLQDQRPRCKIAS
jgi:hypothetical protein